MWTERVVKKCQHWVQTQRGRSRWESGCTIGRRKGRGNRHELPPFFIAPFAPLGQKHWPIPSRSKAIPPGAIYAIQDSPACPGGGAYRPDQSGRTRYRRGLDRIPPGVVDWALAVDGASVRLGRRRLRQIVRYLDSTWRHSRAVDDLFRQALGAGQRNVHAVGGGALRNRRAGRFPASGGWR